MVSSTVMRWALAHQPLVVVTVLVCGSGCFLDRVPIDPGGCRGDEDCPSGRTCVEGVCRAGQPDAGRDAGTDASIADAGRDGGRDAGLDGGTDAGNLCTNGRLDPGEFEVDCGGPCPRCEGPAGVAEMLLWLRAEDVAPGALTTWRDRSGNANDFRAISGVAAPTLTASVAAIGGQPALSFTEPARIQSAAPVALGGSAVLSVVYVIRARASAGIVLESSENFRAAAGAFLEVRNSAGSGQFDSQHGVPPVLASWQTVQLDTAWHWIASVRDLSRTAGEVEVFVDGARSGMTGMNGDVAPPLLDHFWYIGGRQGTPYFQGFDGELAEVIAYTRVLDPDDLAHIGTYVRNRYGL